MGSPPSAWMRLAIEFQNVKGNGSKSQGCVCGVRRHGAALDWRHVALDRTISRFGRNPDELSPDNAKVYTILIHILSCEGNNTNGQSSILFKAAWEISESEDQKPFARGTFSLQPTRWKSGDYGDLASQLSRAVEDLSRELNQAITNRAMMNDKR